MGRIGKIGSSALAIAIVGAALTFLLGWAGQKIARDWQQEDKRLEIRTSLVSRVAATNAEFLGAVRLRGIGAADVAALDAAYRGWAVASSSLGGELGAYVGESEDVQQRWRNFRTGMGYVYYLFRADTPRLRGAWLNRIAAFTAPENVKGQLSVLEALRRDPPTIERPDPVYDSSLRGLIRELEQRSDAIVRSILDSSTTV